VFVDVSSLIAHNPPGLHYGVAVVDIDADGHPEFVVAGFSGPNRVLRWTNGLLREAAPPDLADISRPAVGLAAGDIDGDGREELYVINTGDLSGLKPTGDRLFDPLPNGQWEDLFALPRNRGVRHFSTAGSVGAIDRRGSGRYGFFVATDRRPPRLFELGRDGCLADVAAPMGLAIDSTVYGRGVLTLPILSDHPDIICVTDRGSNLAFRNQGDGKFTECAAALGLADPLENGRGVTAIDAGDGRLSLAWGNWEGRHRMMVRRDDGSWKDCATPGFAFPSAARTVIAADFDNDGRDELFFNNFGEPNRLLRVAADADQPSPDISMLDLGDAVDAQGWGTGGAICDIDRDGVLELLIARGEREPQPLGLYKSREAAKNRWLRVRPLTRFGAPARGSVVRAEMNGRFRVKGICGGSGYLCQMEPVAHFGFGPNGRTERVQVIWPDGATEVLVRPAMNREHTVPYPRG
jgi:hypothetical protein